MDGFAAALSQLDEVILLPIYPAREMPIEGVTSETLAQKINSMYPVRVVQKNDLTAYVCERVRTCGEATVMTLGAGDIDRLTADLTANLTRL